MLYADRMTGAEHAVRLGRTWFSRGSYRSSYLKPYFFSSVATAAWYLRAAQVSTGSNILINAYKTASHKSSAALFSTRLNQSRPGQKSKDKHTGYRKRNQQYYLAHGASLDTTLQHQHRHISLLRMKSVAGNHWHSYLVD